MQDSHTALGAAILVAGSDMGVYGVHEIGLKCHLAYSSADEQTDRIDTLVAATTTGGKQK